ncbi:aldo/keto reductase [Neorhizobium sp. LMR1-1-1.1]
MRTKVFGKTGLKVSELVLGTGNFGQRWGYGSDIEEAGRVLNAYSEAGGNFIDTADLYQFGQSEEFLGQLLAGRREEFLLTSKFTMGAAAGGGLLVTGNSRKAMVTSIEASLKRLRTDRIDIYWAHYADGVTPSEEIVRGFDDLARAGKILYGGLSNFSAWRTVRASTLAEMTGSVPIAGVQVEYSLVHRTPERDVFQAAAALGLGVVTYSPLGGGMLTGKYRNGEQGRQQGLGGNVFQAEDSEERLQIVDTLLQIAQEIGSSPDRVAISWVAAKGLIPMVGPKTELQLKSNLGSLDVILSQEQLGRLDHASHPALLDRPDKVEGFTGSWPFAGAPVA